MIKILLTLILSLTFTISKVTENEIKETVVFENLTSQDQVVGEILITETNERIKVRVTESFEITLPENGKNIECI
jgi:hypothetical protein